ncbi:hypothetical protein JGI2_01308 [Candidatus Kryptobacter tengchongensis]|nr:hypothetical protein JGI2_01308 [Candidatus Kryptobacter tengchongensis]
MKITLGLKLAADILTTLRFLIGFYIVRFSYFEPQDGVSSASLLLWIAWVTDLLDGPISRLDPRKIQTWIGRHDLTADVMVSLGCWLFLVFSNLINPLIGFGYILLGAFLLWYFKSEYLAWALQALPYGLMILTALKYAFVYGILLIAWIIIVVIVTWPRFPKYTLPEFLRGMKALFK